jgi:hypothetical protein
MTASTAAMARRHLSADEALNLSLGALVGIGYSPEQANILAHHMLDAALCATNIPDCPRF